MVGSSWSSTVNEGIFFWNFLGGSQVSCSSLRVEPAWAEQGATTVRKWKTHVSNRYRMIKVLEHPLWITKPHPQIHSSTQMYPGILNIAILVHWTLKPITQAVRLSCQDLQLLLVHVHQILAVHRNSMVENPASVPQRQTKTFTSPILKHPIGINSERHTWTC